MRVGTRLPPLRYTSCCIRLIHNRNIPNSALAFLLAFPIFGTMDRELHDILGRLQAKAEEKRDRAKAAADAEFLADIQSIKRLASLGDDTTDSPVDFQVAAQSPHSPVVISPPTAVHRHVNGNRVGGRKNGPTAAVRKAILQIGDGFTAASLSEFFERAGNGDVSRPAIYSALNKMTDAGEIKRTPVAEGSQSMIYHVIKLKDIK